MISRFNRFEMKYILPFWKCQALMTDLEGVVQFDAHGGRAGYPIVSLYYDSPDFACFWAKVDGVRFRRKLRLRIYPAARIEDTLAAMVEIKQRTNRTVQKRRLELPLALAERLCAGDMDDDEQEALSDLDREVASEVRFLVDSLSLRPTAITAYHRVAMVGSVYEPGLRITFDTQLAGRVQELRVASAAQNTLLANPELCVMEVKSDDAVPEWVTSLLARHDCQLQRVSKYCAVVSHLANVEKTAWVNARTRIATPGSEDDAEGVAFQSGIQLTSGTYERAR